ncbi:D-tyrosyl-tRNA(Tyr) deacylase [Lacunisphaera limnophila]|uniref:D-aminoacyl-tRNA deacylase n=1 Tax=Lacunisphaera limnophila TaxID=1838286 RepID=A0A1D8AX22_9BACT|nr:D-aminoacyl-tRNA deacylase [Lacunisphaera limnophila]AOS45433.1 D-tyrosyl-tRNA(Tyr) deacylase [Lacunisphaera limnophila]
MRVVIQRVSSARVTVSERVTGQIERGLLVLVGIEAADTAADGQWLAEKLVKLRIFDDADGKMNLSLLDLAAAETPASSSALRPLILLVSQFTLHASLAKGTRPSFHAAARPELARPLYEGLILQLAAALGRPDGHGVQTGEFGALMQVASVNDGPVTLWLDSKVRA